MKEPTRLFKIQPIIDYFNDKFPSLYYPSQEIVIDESLLKWHGRLGFAHKILSKTAQVGVKTYELCESSSGYLWKFLVYAGKEKTRTSTTNDVKPDEDETTDKPSASIENNNDRPNNVDDTNHNEAEMTDHTSTGNTNDRPSNATSKIVYDLVEPLLHRGHTLVMDNFYNCPLLARCLKRQNTDCYGTLRLNREFVPDSLKTLTKTELRQGEVVASYCSDLSICVWRDVNIVSLISTYHYLQIGSRQKYNRLTFKPSIVLDYNKSMGGVDRKDQFLSAQPLQLRNGHKQARCWMCAQRKVTARTVWKCLECNINLCIEGCFMEYHI
ncbi:unnamed protein product [Pieris macdunnoughi]|uniref:PiggyBac transposable element-derived protein domain-containing protein n=1 Tax=Pieris macdunnoughi TaxID=345717 RepID=A0A821XEJ8_9NEOP|nr:unnamed protein product [Pieris macdunnoughi]